MKLKGKNQNGPCVSFTWTIFFIDQDLSDEGLSAFDSLVESGSG